MRAMVSSVHLQRHQCWEWYWTMALWQTEEVLTVVLVDCTLDVIPLLSHLEPFAEIDYGFSEDLPQALPSPDPLLAEALHWVSAASGRVNFYSAESVRGRGSFSKAKKPGEGSTGKGAPRAKRPTLATVSASLEHLMAAIPQLQLTSQVQHIADRQEKFETRVMESWAEGSSVFWNSGRHQFGGHCKGFGSSSQDNIATSSWTCRILGPLMNVNKPKNVLELEEEKGEKDFPDQANLAKAVRRATQLWFLRLQQQVRTL